MAATGLSYTPERLALCDKPTWVSATDGDTPTVTMPIRMLGMDAPEFHYMGADEGHPGKFDKDLAQFLDKAGKGLDAGLKAYLQPRLASEASTRQIQQGADAFAHFTRMVEKRLDRGKGKNGKPLTPRRLFVMVASETFDRYGRMLAYVNANYDALERKQIPAHKRPTFNLQMIQEGYAISLLIYPNFPKPADVSLVQKAVQAARSSHYGFWKEPAELLFPYEFRWIVDTMAGKRQGPDRYCGDLATHALYAPQKYYRVEPENRLFFYPEHWQEALKMGFVLTT